MSDNHMGWNTLMHTDAPKGCELRGALFTTYDTPDERLLAEHLLPLLLNVTRDPAPEGAQRSQFLLELDEKLKRLHDRLVVVSSSQKAETEQEVPAPSYSWIWRGFRRLSVGRNSNAVQHSKLWMLHWGAPEIDDQGAGSPATLMGNEYLELVVSSANLTLDSFKGQLQAAWRVCIPLVEKSSRTRLSGWGVLPAFIDALGISTANSESLAPFRKLLARAECPPGTTFLASVPGTHTRQTLQRTPWGAAALSAIAPVGRGATFISILSPFIGSWNEEGLGEWCQRSGGNPKRLNLAWIGKSHPWAKAWVLPKATLNTFECIGSNVFELQHRFDDGKRLAPFHKEHRNADERWSHAKLYAFQRGASKSLLITSANFSMAAWGREVKNGALLIENFELGVCVKNGEWPIPALQPFQDSEDIATTDALIPRSTPAISWASASWDGKEITLECRWRFELEISAEVQCGEEWESIDGWETVSGDPARHATKRWKNEKRQPSVIRLNCGNQTLTVPVFDARPQIARETSIPEEVDESTVQALRDALLFERFGGRVVPDELGGVDSETDAHELSEVRDSQSDANDDGPVPSDSGHSDSYAVPAFEQARRNLGIVDNWAHHLSRVAKGPAYEEKLQSLRLDGERLGAAFDRVVAREEGLAPMMAVGARLASQELQIRLKNITVN